MRQRDGDHVRACAGKKRFANRGEAIASLSRLPYADEVGAYDCLACHGAHLGGVQKGNNRRRRPKNGELARAARRRRRRNAWPS